MTTDTDALRTAAQSAADLFDKDCSLSCSGDWQIEVVTRLRAALAAAPQPAPAPADERAAAREGVLYRFLEEGEVIEEGDECPDDNCASWEPVNGWAVGMGYSKVFKTMRRLVRPDALLAAGWTRGGAEAGPDDGAAECDIAWTSALARPSAPETQQGMTREEVGHMLDAKRKAKALDDLAALGQECDKAATETLAWAVVGEDGKIHLTSIANQSYPVRSHKGETIKRVAIRVVEGEA